MPDVKISALPAATTPLTGTEVLPIVQGGVTDQVTVANLTAGRSVAASTVNVDASTSTAAVRITQTGSGVAILVEDSPNPDATPFVVDTNGRVVVGNTSALAIGPGGSIPAIQAQSLIASNDFAALGTANWVAGGQGASVQISKSRSGVIGTFGIVANNDALGRIHFNGDDGAKFVAAARIEAQVDGTPGLDDMPGRLLFMVTPDGTTNPVERLRISNAGFVIVTGAFGRGAPVTKTGDFTLAVTENWLICNGAGTITVTLPAASSWTGREVMIKTVAAQTVVSASSNVVPLAGGAAGTAILPAVAGSWVTLVSDGTNWITMKA